jgi:hypothetical protein
MCNVIYLRRLKTTLKYTIMSFESRTIPDFLTPDEISAIERIVEHHRTDQTTFVDGDHESGHNAVTHSFFLWMPQYRGIADILIPRLKQHFGSQLKLSTAHILNAYVPYGIHTDVMSGGFDPAGPDLAAWTFIIPLDTYASNTVVFEQHHETIKTLDVWVAETNPEPHAIDDEFHQRYLSHTDRLDLRWLTPESVFPWRKGDLFAADRRKFHVSDNFPAAGLDCKRAIVIWSTVPKQ